MAVVPICYNMCYKDQCFLNSKEMGKNDKGYMWSFIAVQEDYSGFSPIYRRSSRRGLSESTVFLQNGSARKDAKSETTPSTSDGETSEATSYSVRIDYESDRWKKLKSYMKLKNKDGEGGPKSANNDPSDLYFISIFISINIAVFLFELASPIRNSDLELFSVPSVYGAKINHLIILGEWWRLLTPMFLVQD